MKAGLFAVATLLAGIGAAEATIVGTKLDLTGSTASQSSTLGAYTADLAINGNRGDFTHTDVPETNAMWSVELPANASLNLIRVWNRGDGCCPERLRDINVAVYEDAAQQFDGDEANVLSLAEVTVIGGSVPEPSSLALLAPGLLMFSASRRRRR